MSRRTSPSGVFYPRDLALMSEELARRTKPEDGEDDRRKKAEDVLSEHAHGEKQNADGLRFFGAQKGSQV